MVSEMVYTGHEVLESSDVVISVDIFLCGCVGVGVGVCEGSQLSWQLLPGLKC